MYTLSEKKPTSADPNQRYRSLDDETSGVYLVHFEDGTSMWAATANMLGGGCNDCRVFSWRDVVAYQAMLGTEDSEE